MRKIYLTLLGFSILLTVFAANDELYCRKEADWQICRACNSLKEDCEEVDRPCKCDNMKMVKNDGSYGKLSRVVQKTNGTNPAFHSKSAF